jgi:MFS family permease
VSEESSPTEPVARHDPYAALRLANYRWYAAGFLFSSCGLQMLATAVGWEIFQRTNDPLHLGYTGLARALPVVLLALPGGYLADVVNRRWIILISQALFACAAWLLAWWSWASGPIWLVYVLLSLMGCTRAMNGPARGAFLPLIVPNKDFQNVVAWSTGLFHLSGVLGPLLAGWLIGRTGAAHWVYMATGAATMVFSLSMVFIHPLVKQTPAGKITVRSMLSGLGFVYQDKPVFGAIVIDCVGVLLGGATALLPIYADEILKVGPEGLGALRSATFAGAALMSLILAFRRPFQNAGRTFLIAVALWALAVIGFGLSTSFWVAMVFLFMQGAIDNVSVVIRHILVQMRTPDELRGRVSAVNTMFIEISNEMGAFESGVVAKWLGPVLSVVTGGIGTLIVVGTVAVTNKPLREMKTLVTPEGK